MHKIFGTDEGIGYVHRKGACLIPVKDDHIGIIQTPKGFFLLGGGIDVIGYFHPIQTYYLGKLVEQKQITIEPDHKLIWVDYYNIRGKMFLEMQNWALEQCWNNAKDL